MKTRALFVLTLLVLILSFTVSPVYADGIIIPEPTPCPLDTGGCGIEPLPISQLQIKYHYVTVTIEDQVAVTHVDQVFYNPNNWTIEGTYMFPLPEGAVVSNFTLWIDGQPVEGKVLDASQARQTYEEIVRTMQDPALLEYADRGAVQASVYPIPPQGERRIELEYTQALTADNGLVHYVYPLNTEKFSTQPLESVSVSVDIRSDEPIRAAYSTSHEVDTQISADNSRAKVSYEGTNVLPDTDFSLYYSIGETQAFHLLTYRDPSDPEDPDGFYLALLAPQPDVASNAVPKDVILVLDHSGSMEGEKITQAKAALEYILSHLNAEDHFNVISFSSEIDTFASGLQDREKAEQAANWVYQQSAVGSTDINRALLEAAAMTDKERPTYLIFLTDGLPTEGETNSERILDNFEENAPSNLHLFAFGVGYDVDTVLLDSLAQDHHGTSAYVTGNQDLNEQLSTFYAKISTPVLTDLNLDFGSLTVYDSYPNPLPDLFLGSQIVAVGRYKKGGATDIVLTGEVNGKTQRFVYENQYFAEESSSQHVTLSTIPRLWATRKIGYLLSELRLNGNDQETVDQIVRLSIRYGIVTPYTSYLVTEEMPLGASAQERIAEDQYNQLQALPTTVSGEAAVNKAAEQGAMQDAEAPAAAPSAGEGATQIRIVGSRTFVNTSGIWTDTGYDPETMTPKKIAFLSDDYFTLSETRPELASILALGQQVIFLLDGDAYQVVPSGETADPLNIATSTPDTGQSVETTPVSATPAVTDPGASSTPASSTAAPVDSKCLLGLAPIGLIFLLIGAVRPRSL